MRRRRTIPGISPDEWMDETEVDPFFERPTNLWRVDTDPDVTLPPLPEWPEVGTGERPAVPSTSYVYLL